MSTYDDYPRNDHADDGSSAKRHGHNEHPELQSRGKHHGIAEHSHGTSSRLNEYETEWVEKDIFGGGAKVCGGFLKGTLECTHISMPGDGST